MAPGGITIVGNGKTKAILALVGFIQAVFIATLVWALADRGAAWGKMQDNDKRITRLEAKFEEIQHSLDRIETAVDKLREKQAN